MAADPRFNFIISCPNAGKKSQEDGFNRKEFFGTLGKIGDIEALNRIGGGKVSQGLRSLASASDAIRSGDTSSAIITNGVSGDQSGANVVLAEVGINPQQAQKAGQFNPGVLNRGIAEAENVFEQVKQGDFTLEKIPGSFQNLQNLSDLAGGVFTEEATATPIELCGAKPYARALINFAPKHKFMFVVQFTFKEEYARFDDSGRYMAFVVKTSSRPNINIEHEDVNMYNFWSKVARKTTYEPITMRFHDDQASKTQYFINNYIRAISPIAKTRTKFDNQGGNSNHAWLEDRGMINGTDKTASLTKLKGDNTSIFDEIRVFHIYNYGQLMSVNTYINPKITSINFDDLDMSEGSTANEIEIQFAYDALNIIDLFPIRGSEKKVEELSGGAIGQDLHSIVPVFEVGPSAGESAGGNFGIEDSITPASDTDIEDPSGLIAAGSDLIDGAISTAQDAVASVQGVVSGVVSTANSKIDALQAELAAGGPDSGKTPNGFGKIPNGFG